MINVDAIRRLLAVADAQRDPYAVAEVAASLLAANSGDALALGHYARALGVLKLFAAAASALGTASRGDPVPGASGVVPWASRARRFAANLKALEARDPAGAALVKHHAPELPRYQLHQAGDGNFQVLDTRQHVAAGWLGGLADHRAAQALWQFDAARTPVPPAIVFDGLGFGWLFLHVLSTTRRSYVDYSCAAYALEGDPLATAMLLHMHDLQEVILHPRTRWFVRETGEAALAAMRDALRENPAWSIPEQFVRCRLHDDQQHPPLKIEETIKLLTQERHRRREQTIAQAADFYAGKDRAYWSKRFEEALSRSGRGSEKLRVLGITSRYTTVLQHSMAEMHTAVRERFGDACEMRIAIEPDDHSLENPFVEMIAEFRPDLIFQISRLRYENPAIPKNVPFLCWDQDSLGCMRTPEATASLDALTYVAGHGAVFGFTSLGWPRENSIFCHPAGATFRYHDGPSAPELFEKHACDISYVSNASATPESIAEQIRGRWRAYPGWLNVFNQAAEKVLAHSGAGGTWEYVGLKNLVRAITRQFGLPLGEQPWREMIMELNAYADRCFRHTALAWVSRWCQANGRTLRLYGRGWDKHPDFAPHAGGIAQPGEEGRAIYQASRINLQLIEPGFLHSRALDGLAAGGFFLTRQTQADRLDCPDVRTLYRLGCWAAEHSIESDEQLDAVADPQIQKMIETAKAFFRRHELTEPLWRSLHVWAETPATVIIFEELSEITFHDEASFARLARRYLSDDAQRMQVAARMRELVRAKFSYAARWGTFLEEVRRGLKAAAGQPVAAANVVGV